MTGKEKAKELVDRYLNIEFCLLTDNHAIESALICVDEILDAVTTIADKRFDFYTEVKQEINKL